MKKRLRQGHLLEEVDLHLGPKKTFADEEAIETVTTITAGQEEDKN